MTTLPKAQTIVLKTSSEAYNEERAGKEREGSRNYLNTMYFSFDSDCLRTGCKAKDFGVNWRRSIYFNLRCAP